MDGKTRAYADSATGIQMISSLFSYQVIIPTLLGTVGSLLILIEKLPAQSGANSFLDNSGSWLANLPDRTHIQERLAKIGKVDQYRNFRIRQSTLASAGALILAVGLFSLQISPFLILLISTSAFLSIFLLFDKRLSIEVSRYRLSVENEFAALIEMMTLSLSAGETPLAAIARISRHSKSDLGYEFSLVVGSVREGIPFHVALDAMGSRVDSVLIRRFVDALITAMLRGAPLVDVLQRHAAEARQNQRNILMNKAGKAEISMMVPVVFLILPVSVLFALWPSLTHLNLFAT